MPIITIQRQMRELGRIRTGIQVAAGNGRRPSKLETFRITSDNRELVAAAAAAFGGEVRPWAAPEGPEFEVVTTSSTLEIVVPPGQSVSQWYELWSGGGCQRRCDGVRDVLDMGPCKCPPDPAERVALAQKGEACKPTTRLNVMLPAIPDLGVWRLESHGFYAAVELAGAAEVLAAASQSGVLIPARLRLDQRTKKVPGKPPNRYAVPVIEFPQTRMADLIAAGTVAIAGGPAPAQLGAGVPPVRPALPPGPALPATSDFRAPASSGPAGDSDDLEFNAGATAPPADAPLDSAAFLRLVDETEGVDQALVVGAARELFPGIQNLAALSDQARGRLWARTLELAKVPA